VAAMSREMGIAVEALTTSMLERISVLQAESRVRE